MTVELIPAIELRFSSSVWDKAGNTPPFAYWEHLELWEDYRNKLLNLCGMQQYKAFRPGDAFYPVLQFTNLVDLKKIVDNHLDPLHQNDQPIKDTCSLFGGTVLVTNGEVKLLPQCCGTLADFLDWKRVLNDNFRSGYILTGGHPSPKANKEKKEVVLECFDDAEEFIPATDRVVRIEIEPLRKAVEKAESELLMFSNTLDNLSKEYGVNKLSNLMIWERK